jgi:hypothetical protein
MRGEEGVAGSQPMSTAVHMTLYGAQNNFGDQPPYLTYSVTPWRNLENNALSSLHKLLRYRLVGGGRM